jgi:hypothetical protein
LFRTERRQPVRDFLFIGRGLKSQPGQKVKRFFFLGLGFGRLFGSFLFR